MVGGNPNLYRPTSGMRIRIVEDLGQGKREHSLSC